MLMVHYIEAAMHEARYEVLEDGTWYGKSLGSRASGPTPIPASKAARNSKKSWRNGSTCGSPRT